MEKLAIRNQKNLAIEIRPTVHQNWNGSYVHTHVYAMHTYSGTSLLRTPKINKDTSLIRIHYMYVVPS